MEPQARLDFDARLCLPNHALFVGATMSGKTRLCLHLLSNPHLFHPRPSKILFYYDQFQESYLQTKTRLQEQGIDLLLFKGFPCDLSQIGNQDGQTILLIDDFSEESSASREIAKLATNGRHLGISLWLVWHSLFSKHAASRVICQNMRWFFFLPSLRLESQIASFGTQLGMKQRLLAAFRDCQTHEDEHQYIMVDSGPRTPDLLRVRSRIHDTVHQFCYT